MDDATLNMLREMDRFGGTSLENALHAEALGYPVPFYTVEFLVVGKISRSHVPGPSLKMTMQLPYKPSNGVDVERWKNRAWKLANDAFRREPLGVHQQFQRCYDPSGWGQSFHV